MMTKIAQNVIHQPIIYPNDDLNLNHLKSLKRERILTMLEHNLKKCMKDMT